MNDFIIKLLDLKEKDLDFIESITKTESSDFIIILKRSIQVCPHCGSLTDRIKDYKIRKLNHKVLFILILLFSINNVVITARTVASPSLNILPLLVPDISLLLLLLSIFLMI